MLGLGDIVIPGKRWMRLRERTQKDMLRCVVRAAF